MLGMAYFYDVVFRMQEHSMSLMFSKWLVHKNIHICVCIYLYMCIYICIYSSLIHYILTSFSCTDKERQSTTITVFFTSIITRGLLFDYYWHSLIPVSTIIEICKIKYICISISPLIYKSAAATTRSQFFPPLCTHFMNDYNT